MRRNRNVCEKCGRTDGGPLKVVRIGTHLDRYVLLRRWCERCRIALTQQRSR